jgi:uncharacterized membrane protein (UPF0127 family)
MHIINARTKAIVATDVEIAETREARNRGLLGRDRLDPSAGLVLSPCFMIHTAFMRFPIDVVFVDRYGFAIKIVKNLGPWRVAIAPGARMTIELAAGVIESRDLQVGDPVYFAPAPTGSAPLTGALSPTLT